MSGKGGANNSDIQPIDQWNTNQQQALMIDSKDNATSQQNTANRQSVPNKQQLSTWFLIGYIAVSFLIIGIISILIGSIFLILKWIKFQTKYDGKDYHLYFGQRIPKMSGPYILIAGIGVCLISGILYRVVLERIDYHIQKLYDASSKQGPKKKKRKTPKPTKDNIISSEEEKKQLFK